MRGRALDARTRRRFDELLERVLAEMPPLVHELIEQVPLHVEDYPSARVMDELGVEYRDDLCGLYTGIPLNRPQHRAVGHVARRRDHLSRRNSLVGGRPPTAESRDNRLRKQIRITILHELAHHHGLEEDELRELGYG